MSNGDSRCKVCKSENTEIYEKLREEGNSLESIVEKAKEDYGDDFSLSSLYRHMQNHYEPKKQEYKRKELAEEMANREAEDEIDRIKEIKENLSVARSLSTRAVDELRNQTKMSSSKINAIKGLLTEIRQTIRLVSELEGEIQSESNISEEQMVDLLITVVKRLGVEDSDTIKKVPEVVKEEVEEKL